jgi:hypothetical protein
MKKAMLKKMADEMRVVRLYPHPIRILYDRGGVPPRAEVLDTKFELTWSNGKPALVSPGGITIRGLSASEINNFVEPDWLVMRKALEFTVRWVGPAAVTLPAAWSPTLGSPRARAGVVKVPTANQWEVTHDWKVVPHVVCPACGANLH